MRFKGTTGLWELLTRKNVNSNVITKSDLNAYKRILVRTNAHLAGYETGGDIHVSRGVKYVKVISKLFPPRRGGDRGEARYVSIRARSVVATPRPKVVISRCAC